MKPLTFARRARALLAALALATSAAPLALSAQTPEWLSTGSQKNYKKFEGRQEGAAAAKAEDRRGKVTIRRLRPKCYSDWSNDPTALPYLFYQLSLRTNREFPCYVNNEGLDIASDEIFQYPIIYFTSHYAFNFTEEEVQYLRKYLRRGGTLWLDDCTGSGPFMDCVARNVERIEPGIEMKLTLITEKEFEPLYSLVYPFSGVPIIGKQQFCRPMQAGYVQGRPAILFSPNDYGCWWEIGSPPTALNPLGGTAHGYEGNSISVGPSSREIAYQWCINWLVYTLTH